MKPQWPRVALQINGLTTNVYALDPRYPAMPLTLC